MTVLLRKDELEPDLHTDRAKLYEIDPNESYSMVDHESIQICISDRDLTEVDVGEPWDPIEECTERSVLSANDIYLQIDQ